MDEKTVRDNERCLRIHVEDDRYGRTLTHKERDVALRVAAENWTGTRTAGEAVHIGLEFVRQRRERG